MEIPQAWLYPPSLEEAKKVQKFLAHKVIAEDQLPPRALDRVGGMDVSNYLYDPAQKIYAATVVLSFPEQKCLEIAAVVQKQKFPYIPGFLGFREAPALVASFQALRQSPAILWVDGHGISHPRRLGIASHIGVLLDIPTIGVAKSILVGSLATPLGEEVGSQSFLIWKGKMIAIALRTKKRAHPILISIGHKISLNTAVELVKKSLKGYRLPEPTRQAHLAANQCRREGKEIKSGLLV